MAVYVGLDCGGSSTRVLAIDDSGNSVFRGQGGAANLLSTPLETLQRSLATATQGCPPPASVCGCFAGLVDQDVEAAAIGHLRKLFPSCPSFRTEPDYAAALAACGPNTAACVIAGTGSIVCSRNGKLAKSGGRGPLLGDEGSACEIGKRGLRLYLDGKSLGEELGNAVCEILGAEEPGIIRRLYSSSSPAALLAKLAGPVAKEAETNPAFQTIVEEEMVALAARAAAHIAGFSPTGSQIGLAGGLWKTHPVYRSAFERQLAVHMNIPVFVLRKAPVEGAAELAREAALVH